MVAQGSTEKPFQNTIPGEPTTMSLAETKEEAEAVLDSAEMIIETMPRSDTTRELERKISELESEIQDPDSERSLRKLIDEIRELMDDIQEEPVGEPMGGPDQGGMGGEGMPPDDDMPPI